MSYEQLKNPCNTKDGNLQQSGCYYKFVVRKEIAMPCKLA